MTQRDTASRAARIEFIRLLRSALEIPDPLPEDFEWVAPPVCEEMGKLLGDSQALTRSDLTNWRRAKEGKGGGKYRLGRHVTFPRSFVLGAALGTVMPKKLRSVADFDSITTDQLAFVNDLFFRIIGLRFGSVQYECTLSLGDEKDVLNHRSITRYREIQVHPDFLPFVFPIEHQWDEFHLPKAKHDFDVNCSGNGIRKVGHSIARISRSIIPTDSDRSEGGAKSDKSEGGARSESSAQGTTSFIQGSTEIQITEIPASNAQIEVRRSGVGSFALTPAKAGGRQYERAGQPVLYPIDDLSLSLEFPPGLFSSPADVPVEMAVWKHGTWRYEGFHHVPTTRLLASKRAQSTRWKWTWRSEGPVAFGMLYALMYDIDIANLKRSLHARV